MNKLMRGCIVVSFLILSGSLNLQAQQYPLYTQYTLNKYIYNPAVAGVNGYSTVSFVAREQWAGMKGSPKTLAISFDSRKLGESFIMKRFSVRKRKPGKTRSSNSAFGGYFIGDWNGPIEKIWFSGSYAYHIDLQESQLSFGLSILFSQLRIKGDDFVLPDDITDDLLTSGKQSIWITDANFGVFYTAKQYYAGYSTIQLFNSSFQLGNDLGGEYRLNRQHMILAGYLYDLKREIQLEPSLLIKIPENSKAQVDLNIKATYDRRYWGGLGFRTGKVLSVFAGLNLENYHFGYAFDYYFSSVMTNTYGSHELMAILRFGESGRRYRWLNRY